MTKETKKNIGVKELQKLFIGNDEFIGKLKSITDAAEVRKLIRAALTKEKDVLTTTVTSYMKKLKELPPDGIVSPPVGLVPPPDGVIPPPVGVVPPPVDVVPPPVDVVPPPVDVVPPPIGVVPPPVGVVPPLVKETIVGTSQSEKYAIYVGESILKEMDALKIENNELVIKNNILTNENEVLKKLTTTKEKKDIKDDFMSQIPSLNDILNSENDKTTVSINKDLLIKATKFVDAHSLIRLETIIRNGYDLNSTIVQSILLSFIYQNSLL